MIKIILLVTLLVTAVTVTAQIEKIDTDRPDQTESAFTVPKKWMQFESGFLKEVDKGYYSPFTKWTDIRLEHPSLLTKYGVGKRFELRLITGFATYKLKDDNQLVETQTGIDNVQFGGKLNFFDEKGWRPKISLIAHYDFAGLRTINKDTTDGINFRFTMQHTISEKVSLGYNLGMEWERFGEPAAYTYTFAPGFNLSEKWYAYIEAFGFIWKNEKPENSIDGGIAYYVTDNFKLDASAGFGLNKKAPDYYFAIGTSFRFKTTNK
ncbi:transporter [Ferruginibacter sp. SUN106]|uniref:transporter n=1 Tax=Ferruginibacter sp. SUN106 TaxID=2978348 RepID=UPI003D35AED3